MERPLKGDIVIIRFPFTDLSGSKRRHALVVAAAGCNDVILCQITSQSVKDELAVELTVDDFSQGSLKKTSNVRPNRIFTADTDLIIYKAAALTPEKMRLITDRIVDLLRR
jgi:mRNA interferase MazF